MFRRILVPLDGSDLAEQALPLAVELARRLEANLWLARVSLAVDFVVGPAGVVAPYSEVVQEQLRAEAAAYLGGVRTRLIRPGLTVTTVVLEGPVAAALIHYARAQQIDLIVMATRGHAGLSRWLHRNVADNVQQGAPCPTLIVSERPLRAAAPTPCSPSADDRQRLHRH